MKNFEVSKSGEAERGQEEGTWLLLKQERVSRVWVKLTCLHLQSTSQSAEAAFAPPGGLCPGFVIHQFFLNMKLFWSKSQPPPRPPPKLQCSKQGCVGTRPRCFCFSPWTSIISEVTWQKLWIDFEEKRYWNVDLCLMMMLLKTYVRRF